MTATDPTSTAQDRTGPDTPNPAEAGALCNDRKVWPRDAFARLARAEVWCDKPAGHKGPHGGVKGSMLFVWRRCVSCNENPPAAGSDICAVCHDAN